MTLPCMSVTLLCILKCIYVDSKLILCFIHMIQGISKIYLLQVITPNYLKRVKKAKKSIT